MSVNLSELAASLKDNEAFQASLDRQRTNALDRLATMPRSDEEGFYASQAIVAVIDTIRGDLDQFIRDGKPKAKPGIA